MEMDTQRRLEDLPRSRLTNSALEFRSSRGPPGVFSLSERCGLAQDLILRFEITRRWWRRGDSNS